MTYFGPMPKSSLDMRRVNDWVQHQVQTFYKNITFTGDVTINGFLRTGLDFPYIEIRPDSGTGGRPAITLFNPNGDGALIETRDMGGSIEAMLLAGPNAGTGVSEIHLRDNGHVWVHSDVASGLINLRVNDTTVMEVQDDEVRILQPVSRADEPAYFYKETIYYTSDNTFTKADYPGLRAVRVQAAGAGGGGGGAGATTGAQNSFGLGGSSGGYAESWILAADLDTTEAVTVGTGGAGNSGAAGSNGEDTVFDTISGEVRAKGGQGGAVHAATSASGSTNGTAGQAGSVGDLTITAGTTSAGHTWITSANQFRSGEGGTTPMGFGIGGGSRATSGNGISGTGYGSGGGGGGNGVSQSAKTGATGNDGIVIVHVYV